MQKGAKSHRPAMLGIVVRSKASVARGFLRGVIGMAALLGFGTLLLSSLFIYRGWTVLSPILLEATRAWAFMLALSTAVLLIALPVLNRNRQSRFPRILALVDGRLWLQLGSDTRAISTGDAYWWSGFLSDGLDGVLLPREPAIVLVTNDGISAAFGGNIAQRDASAKLLEDAGIQRVYWWSDRRLAFWLTLGSFLSLHLGLLGGSAVGKVLDWLTNMNQWQRAVAVSGAFLLPLAGASLLFAIGRKGGPCPSATASRMLACGAVLLFGAAGQMATDAMPLAVRLPYAGACATIGALTAIAFHRIRRSENSISRRQTEGG